jgi:hypothetical protein
MIKLNKYNISFFVDALGTHDFELHIPKEYDENFTLSLGFDPRNYYKCNGCSLVIGKNALKLTSLFFISSSYNNILIDINLTCDEMVLMNIL